ncbi:hypothetical protein ACFRQM_11920 [Streptomyces sp. NPDC056831]|uniref:hypothetical protein n=1 Tax=Streptomyces sp. NPDC056831 TaxID=3345954 RepID=UPI0036B7D5A5
MTTQTTELGQQAETPTWRTALQLATNATWHAAGRISAAPFSVTQDSRGGGYIGQLHYLELESVQAFAAEFRAELDSGPSASGGVRYQATALVDNILVIAWAFVPSAESGDLA